MSIVSFGTSAYSDSRGQLMKGLYQIAAVIMAGCCTAIADDFQTGQDLTNISVPAFPAEKDTKTGFIVGGKNETVLIKGLTELNGRTIDSLEKDMRPGAWASKGFLGESDRLIDTLADDNHYIVDQLGLTHQEIAKHLRALGAAAEQAKSQEFRYHGRRFKATVRVSRWYQPSPFRDGTQTNALVIADNLDADKRLEYSLLMPDLIERYGFYEGRGTPYRLDPKKIVEFLDFLKPNRP
jgi:hypothetical protein